MICNNKARNILLFIFYSSQICMVIMLIIHSPHLLNFFGHYLSFKVIKLTFIDGGTLSRLELALGFSVQGFSFS